MPDLAITWQSKGHVSSDCHGLNAVTFPGFKCWAWTIHRKTIPTGVTGTGFATEEAARRDAERAMVEMARKGDQ